MSVITTDEMLEAFAEHLQVCKMIQKLDNPDYYIQQENDFQYQFLAYESFEDGETACIKCDMIGCDWELKFKVDYVYTRVKE